MDGKSNVTIAQRPHSASASIPINSRSPSYSYGSPLHSPSSSISRSSPKPHRFNQHLYSNPTKCSQCATFIWGLDSNGYLCQECGFAIHQKCLSAVPANCTRKAVQKAPALVRVKSIHLENSGESDDEDDAKTSMANARTRSRGLSLLKQMQTSEPFQFDMDESETEDETDPELIDETDGEAPDIIEEKDQVGALLQLIRSRANVLTVSSDPRQAVVRPRRQSLSRKTSATSINKLAPIEIKPTSGESQPSSPKVGSPMSVPVTVGSPDSLQRKSNESEIDFLLRVTKTASQPGIMEELQKQHLSLAKLTQKSDELSDFEDDDMGTSSVNTPTAPSPLSTQSLEFAIPEKPKREEKPKPKDDAPLPTRFAEDRRGSLPANLDDIPPPDLRQRRTSIVLQSSPAVTTASKIETVPYPTSPKNRIKKMYELYEASSERQRADIERTQSFTHMTQRRPRSATTTAAPVLAVKKETPGPPIAPTSPRMSHTVSRGTGNAILQGLVSPPSHRPLSADRGSMPIGSPDTNRPRSGSGAKEVPKKIAKLIEDLNAPAVVKEQDPAEKQWLAATPGFETDACIAIELKLDREEYIPGETISGAFYLDLIKPLRYTDGVKVLFQGFEKAYKGNGVFSASEGPTKKNKTDYQTEMFFKHKVILWEPTDKDPILLPGQHTWNFSFDLPMNLPPTLYFEDWASIFYQCRGYVDPGLNTTVKRQAIVSEKVLFDVYGVNSQLWKSIILPYTTPMSASKANPKRNVRVHAEIERKDYYHGENLKIRIKMDNESDKKVLASVYKLSLIQNVKVHTKSWHCEFETAKLASQTFTFKDFKLLPKTTGEKTFEIHIPEEDVDETTPLFPTSTGLLFTVTHHLKIAINVKGFKPLLIPVRLWESFWGTPEEIVHQPIIKPPVHRPSVTIAPSNWRFQTVKVWSKPLRELPVAIDLPRLAGSMSIVDISREIDRIPVASDYCEAIQEYKATGISARLPDGKIVSDVTCKQGEIVTIVDSDDFVHEGFKWTRVLADRTVGLVPSHLLKPVGSPLAKEENILSILTTLALRLEGEAKVKKIVDNFWKYIPRDTNQKGDRDVSRELNRFLFEVMGEDSPTTKILKGCNQSIIAPAVIELTLNVCPKIAFKDGGGWRIRVKFTERDFIEVSHWKKQKHVPRPGEPELFTFEWQLAFTMDRKAESIVDFSFQLANVEFTEAASPNKRDEISSILHHYFKYGPSTDDTKKIMSIFPYVPRKDSLWATPKNPSELELQKIPLTRQRSMTTITTEKSPEKLVSKFFSVSTSQQLRDLDIVYDSRDTKLQNLSKYVDEDEALYEALSEERKARITLEEKIRRKWKKSHEELLIATLLPGVYRKIEITTADGLIRLSPFYSQVDATQTKNKSVRSFLESLAILLSDVKETLPNLIKYFRIEQETSPHYLGKFMKEYMGEDCRVMKCLKATNLSIMASAFSVLKEQLHKRFPFTDIGSAWKITFNIGKGDGSPDDGILITHSKAAKSLDNSVDGSFEFLWQLQLHFTFDLRELKGIALKIPHFQTSSRFSKTKLKEITTLIKHFNGLDHSVNIKKQQQEVHVDYALRKKARQKLRKLPKSELGAPVLRKDCTLYIKIIEAKNIGAQKTRAKRSSSFLDKLSKSNGDATTTNPYCKVKVGDQKQRTRTIYNSSKPFWSEEYTFDIVNPHTQTLKIKLCDAQQFSSDIDVGYFQIPLKTLLDQETKEEWFTLLPPEKKDKDKEEKSEEEKSDAPKSAGQLRVKVKYSEEIVLPGPLYDEMLELLLDRRLDIVNLLGRVTESGEDRDHIIVSLVKIFEEKDMATILLNSLAADEINKTNNPEVIFRGNSIASRALDSYMKFIAHNYLTDTLTPLLSKIYAYKKSLELDPMKVEKASKIESNVKKIEAFTQQFLDAIFSSAENCPASMREIFRHLQECVQEKYTEEQIQVTQYTCVSGYIFLRFFCPAIMGPKLFHVMELHPDINTSRTLMIIAKVIQKLANLQTFLPGQEEYLHPLNKVIEDNIDNMKRFINEVSTVPTTTPPRVRPPIQLEKELASIHRYLKKSKELMIKQQNENEHSAVKRLVSVLDNLEYISQHEKMTEYPQNDTSGSTVIV